MKRVLPLSLLLLGAVLPAAAQDHSAHQHPADPPPVAADPHAGHVMPAPAAADPHAGHVMPPPAAADPHAGHAMPAPAAVEDESGDAPPPPSDHAADRIYGAAAMAVARDQVRREHGAGTLASVMLNLAEVRATGPGGGARWNGVVRYGGDLDGVTLKTEGESRSGELERAELQVLYVRAIDPTFNLEAGLRADFRPRPSRAYATLGVEGLAPYWFDVGAALFVSTRGDARARLEAAYDLLVTQRLVLQPRVELNFAAKNVASDGTGSGLSNAEIGLRLRYEFSRQFAPYVGLSYDRRLGNTARFARAAGERAGGTFLVVGVRAWF